MSPVEIQSGIEATNGGRKDRGIQDNGGGDSASKNIPWDTARSLYPRRLIKYRWGAPNDSAEPASSLGNHFGMMMCDKDDPGKFCYAHLPSPYVRCPRFHCGLFSPVRQGTVDGSILASVSHVSGSGSGSVWV